MTRLPKSSYEQIGIENFPLDWKVQTLKYLSIRITDGCHQSVKTSESGVIPFLYVSCIRDGQILWNKAAKITEEVYQEISKGRTPQPGVIIYTIVGSYGEVALIESTDKFSFQRHIAYILPDSKKIYPKFLYHWLNSGFTRSQAHKVAVGNAQKTIVLAELCNLKVLVPSLRDEQIKIANVLSSIDGAISLTQSIINQLQLIKHGLIKRLFTGDSLGICSECKPTHLYEIITSLDSGVSLNAEDRHKKDNEYGVLKLSCISSGKFFPLEHKVINSKDLARFKVSPKKEAILISRSNTPNLVGECGYIDKDYSQLFLSDLLWQVELKKGVPVCPKWLTYMLVHLKDIGVINRIATGTSNSMKKISKTNFLKLSISLPSLLEQTKIADILTTIDKRLQAEEGKKQQLEVVKKALMQQLLTGKLRVPGGEP